MPWGGFEVFMTRKTPRNVICTCVLDLIILKVKSGTRIGANGSQMTLWIIFNKLSHNCTEHAPRH